MAKLSELEHVDKALHQTRTDSRSYMIACTEDDWTTNRGSYGNALNQIFSVIMEIRNAKNYKQERITSKCLLPVEAKQATVSNGRSYIESMPEQLLGLGEIAGEKSKSCIRHWDQCRNQISNQTKIAKVDRSSAWMLI